ncbi:MAG: hypothetical protein HN732_22160 [Rhodospirillaceae bacterium]|nr:hypothetical protein [Rhodospirillaceae bacterium]
MTFATNSTDGGKLGYGSRGNDAASSAHGLTVQIRLLAGLLVLSLALTVASLFWSAQSQDKIAEADARHLAGTALKVQMSILQKLLTDYTWWDDAYLKSVAAFDPGWFDENFGNADYLRDTFGVTGSFIVGPDNRILRHMRNSEIVGEASKLKTADYFGGGIGTLIQNARRLVDGKFVATAGYARLDGQYYFASARAIHPHTDDLIANAAVAPDNAFVAAFLRPLDAPLLQTLARDFGLPDLRYIAPGDGSGRMPLQTANGKDFGALDWQVDRPSQYVLRVTLPGLLLVILCIAVLGWFVFRNLRRERAKLWRAMEQAQLADRSKSDFLANMSHELRTPLNAIIGFSEILRDETLGPLGNPRYSDYGTNINESGRLLLDIINDVLDLSKIEAGKYVLQETEVALPEVVEPVCRLIKPHAAEKNIALQIDIASDLPSIHADSRALKQILLNLLSNAVKFTPPGGKVVLAVTRKDNGAVELMVADTGCGIPRDQLKLVMRPFHQVNSPLMRSEGGTGLGLPFSASLVSLHGGDIQIDSEVDKGTTVRVTFPSERARVASAT